MSRRNIYILSGVGLIALIALFWFFLLSPLREGIAETEAQIEVERQSLMAAQAKLAQLEQYRKAALRNEARLLELAKMVPSSDEVPSLILQVQDLASEAGIDFLQISPGEAQAVGDYSVIALSLQMEGTFFDINDFIYRAEQLAAGPGRLLSVAQVDLAPASEAKKGKSPDLAAGITMKAFRRPPGAALPDLSTAGPAAPASPVADSPNPAG